MAQDRPQYQRLAREMERCGWFEMPLEILEGELFFQTFQGGCAACCARYQNEKGQRLLLIGLEQLSLPPREDLFARFLNLPLESRMALSVARLLGEPDWLLLLTRGRQELFRLPDETCLLSASDLETFDDELAPALAALAHGREESLSPGAGHLPGADSLAAWIRHWAMQIAAALQIDHTAVQSMIWKWILMLQVPRRTEGTDLLGGWGLSCARQDGRWTIGYDSVSSVDELSRALELFDENFATNLFAYETAMQLDWVKRLEETTLLDRLRAELLMHTQDHFEPETVAWMFTDLAREQEGWRREMTGEGRPLRQRFRHDGWSVLAPLTSDVARDGLTTALRETERLARYLADLNLFMKERRRTEPAAGNFQPDLFCQNPRGIGPHGGLDDGLNFLFGEALRLKGVTAERRFGVGVTFMLKALALSQKMEWPFLGLDTLDRLFL